MNRRDPPRVEATFGRFKVRLDRKKRESCIETKLEDSPVVASTDSIEEINAIGTVEDQAEAADGPEALRQARKGDRLNERLQHSAKGRTMKEQAIRAEGDGNAAEIEVDGEEQAVEVNVQDRRRLAPDESVVAVPPSEDGEAGEEEVVEEEQADEGNDDAEVPDVEEGDAEEVEAAFPVTGVRSQDRLSHLEERCEHLQSELARSEQKEGDMTEALEALKEDLAEGTCSADEIALGEEKLASRRKATAALRDALGKVGAERDTLAGQIAEVARSREKARQEKASRRFHRDADEALGEFLDGVAGLLDPLRRRVEIVNRCRGKLPMASPIHALKFDELVVALDRRLESRAPLAVRFYLLRLLNGVNSGSQVALLDPAIARELGIEG
jgi:hypothetical protein